MDRRGMMARRSFLRLVLGTGTTLLVPKSWIPPRTLRRAADTGRLRFDAGLLSYAEEVSGNGYVRTPVEFRSNDGSVWSSQDGDVVFHALSDWGEVTHLALFEGAELILSVPIAGHGRTVCEGNTVSVYGMSVRASLVSGGTS